MGSDGVDGVFKGGDSDDNDACVLLVVIFNVMSV